MLRQDLQQKLQQKLSPQQIQLMKLVQLPTVAFEQRIKEELEENPALEDTPDYSEDEMDNKDDYDDYEEADKSENESIDDIEINVDEYLSDDEYPSYKSYTSNYSADDEEKHVPYASGTSFNQYLKTQLSTLRLDEKEKSIAEFLVGSVDESGYIRRTVQDIPRISMLRKRTWRRF